MFMPKKLEKIKKFKLFSVTEGIILKFDKPSCRITQVTDSPLEVYTDHQNRYVIFDDNSSASQTDRLELRANIWTAAKKPTMVMSLVADPRTEAAQEDYFLLALDHLPDVIFEENKEDVKQMVRLFDLSRRFSLGLTQEKHRLSYGQDLIILRPARAQNLFGRNYFLIPKIPRKRQRTLAALLRKTLMNFNRSSNLRF